MSDDRGYIRIGELSRRVGVSPELLRAWERRYSLLRPSRSPGGFRLYSDADVSRVEAMKEALARGLSAAEAARRVREGEEERAGAFERASLLEAGLGELREALRAFDEAGAHAALDRLLASLSLDAVLRDAVLPLLRELGESWARGETTVAQEHFASNLVRGRLLALGRGWGRGSGPQVLLACPPGELHDLGLIVFGLALRNRGWRITFLGADTPISTVRDTAQRLEPDLVVLATLLPSRFERVLDELLALAARWPVAIAGAGATPELAARCGAECLEEGPYEAAERLARERGLRR
ncbi:MAG: MerR family transcriptional regulator [Thermoleophilia bacterium]|nr:MerR family transcriptional regulator [Gaiellaceae bacterium]MDW8337519.1 MerR family transcriptional regulator [Thermoleophilia bacterium]